MNKIDKSFYLLDKDKSYLNSPVSLELKDGNIYVKLSYNDGEYEFVDLQDYLGLTGLEKFYLKKHLANGYILVGQKYKNGDYPDYFKKFHHENPTLFLDSSEITEPRDFLGKDHNGMFGDNRENMELIFVKLNLPKNISKEVEKETFSFSSIVNKILSNLSLNK